MKYKYEVIRSARKSIAVSVSSSNKITVRCPWGVRPEQIENFLDLKADWIEKVILNNSKKLAFNDDVIELREIYVAGRRLPLVFGDKEEITEDRVCVKNVSRLCKLFEKHCFPEFLERVNAYAKKTVLYPASVGVKDYKGRWGGGAGKKLPAVHAAATYSGLRDYSRAMPYAVSQSFAGFLEARFGIRARL